jgi:hypothetical protein
MNIDPTMPTLTLGLSEWRKCEFRGESIRLRHWMAGGEDLGEAAVVFSMSVSVFSPSHKSLRSPSFEHCDGVEDGMSKADAMLRKWIEGVPQ